MWQQQQKHSLADDELQQDAEPLAGGHRAVSVTSMSKAAHNNKAQAATRQRPLRDEAP
jgi:hypothetical protein